MQARYYQTEAEQAIWREWDKGNKKTLLVLPTGCGKTIVFSFVMREAVRKGLRCLVLAHRGELLEQAAEKLEAATGLKCAVEKAEESCKDSWYRVVVGSVQTLMRPKRLESFPRNYFDVIIVDEAHHVLAESYQRILNYFDQAFVLGVTATPDRGDMRELGEYFDSLAYEYQLPRAIRDGFLVPIKALSIPIALDLNSVSVRSGDFRAEDVGTALEPYLEKITDEMVNHCTGRRTVVFLPLIATSQKFCDILKARGFRAAEVNGESTDRKQVIQAFQDGHYDVLCNSMLLTEGWDCPPVDCIVPLRPTKIRSLYSQIVGRGTRLAEGKDYLLLLDFLWLSDRHELCRPAHLLAPDKLVADIMTEKIAAAGCPVDIQEAEIASEGDAIAQREEALAKRLAEQRNKKAKLVDPLQYEMSIRSEELLNYVPAFGWEAKPPTQLQMEALEKAGIYGTEITNAGHAAKLLDQVQMRRDRGLTTAKQIRFLEGKGFRDVGTWEFGAAKKLIDRIAGNGWRVPAGINPSDYRPAPQQKMELAS